MGISRQHLPGATVFVVRVPPLNPGQKLGAKARTNVLIAPFPTDCKSYCIRSGLGHSLEKLGSGKTSEGVCYPVTLVSYVPYKTGTKHMPYIWYSRTWYVQVITDAPED